MGTIQLDGMVSGLDTTSIVKSLVSVSKGTVTLLEKQKTTIQSKKDRWSSFSQGLADLKTAIQALDTTSELKKMKATSNDSDKVGASVVGTALAGTYNVTISQLANAQLSQVNSQQYASGASTFTTDPAQTLSISVNGGAATNVSLAGQNTLDGAISAVNAANAGVTAYKILDATSGQYSMFVTSNKTGADYNFTITGAADITLGTVTAAQDTEGTVNGLNVSSETRDLTDAIPGVTLSALDETTVGVPVQISITNDNDKMKEAVNGILSKYNSIMSFVNSEVKYSDTTKTTGGILASDNTLRTIQRQLQSLAGGSYAAGNSINTLKQMGISTQSGGTLSMDSTIFGNALNTSLEDVMDFFTNTTDGMMKAFSNATSTGRLDLILDSTSGTIKEKTKSYDSQITTLNTQIDKENTRLGKMETNLRARFTALEVALSKIKGTQGYVAGLAKLTSSSSS